jgi:subtilisin family serine protease
MMLLRNCLFVFFYCCLFPVLAQQFEPGVIRVKLKSPYESQVNATSMEGGSFGIAEIDRHKSTFGITKVRRLFRPSEKFERAHRKYGLHLWYEISFNKNIPLATALKSFKGLSTFEVVEGHQQFYSIDPIQSGQPVQDPKTNSLNNATNDPLFSLQWHYQNTGQTSGTIGADIKLTQAWTITTGNPAVIVAVIDGGIDINHPDLAGSIWTNTGEIAGNNIDDDHNGYIDDVHGFSFGDGSGTISPHNHGTHVAGTIAAVTNNSIGVSGIAGGSGTGNGVRLMSCAAFGLNANGGFEDAMVYAADNGAVISQNSWGGGSGAIEDAIDYFIERAGYDNSNANFNKNIQIGPMAGGIVMFAAGNDNSDDPDMGYPASYPPVMAVASTDHNDHKSSFSDYGSWVDIAAPGTSVYSTLPGSNYTYFSGTSMACPHVSGVAALIVSQYGGSNMIPSLVRSRLQATADDIGSINPAYIGKLGSGRLNAFKALQPDDDVAPGPISDLAVSMIKLHSIVLNWTATGESGSAGTASFYDIRYSTAPINAANFNTATSVPVPPVPSPAGTSEVFELTGLAHQTQYYVAIKAIDFLGNSSIISNVVSGTTPLPPIIAVNPLELEGDLLSGNSTQIYITIENNGASDLSVNLSSIQNDVINPPWLSVSGNPVTIAPGNSTQVAVVLDASSLYGGVYEGEIKIESNDPVTPSVNIPLTLSVTGIPHITVANTIDFQNGFINFAKDSSIMLYNTGTDVLMVSGVSITGSAFGAGANSFSIPAGDSTQLALSFHPVSEALYSETMTITSNDPDLIEAEVSLSGNGIPAPVVDVDPLMIEAALNVGDVTLRIVTISNLGASELNWQARVTRPQTSANHGLTEGQFTPRASSPSDLTCLATDPTTGLIYAQQSGGSAFYKYNPFSNTWTQLKNSPIADLTSGGAVYLGGKIYTVHANSTTIAVYTISSASWATLSGQLSTTNITTDGTYLYLLYNFSMKRYNPETNVWTNLSIPPISFSKWGGMSYHKNYVYAQQGYGQTGFARYSILQNKWFELSPLPGGAVSGSAIDPVTETFYAYGSYGETNFYAYDLQEKTWSVKTSPFEVDNGGLVYVDQPAISGTYFIQGDGTTGFARLEGHHNMINLETFSGTLDENETYELVVTLDATNVYGGSYSGEVVITSNDPANQKVTIPVVLQITGIPDITADVSTLDMGKVYTDSHKVSAVTIKNTGTDSLKISSLATDNHFEISNTPFTLAPEQTKVLFVTFENSEVGSYQTMLSILTNDPDEPVFEVLLKAKAVVRPLTINPESVDARVVPGKIVAADLTIVNQSADLFSYDISISFDGTSTVWMTLNPSEGSIASGKSKVISGSISSKFLLAGIYHATISITCSHPDAIPVYVPVTLEVVNEPDIHVSSSDIDFSKVFLEHPGHKSVTVSNRGSEILHINSITSSNEQFSVSEESIILNADDSLSFYIHVNPLAAGDAEGIITLNSDDPDSPLMEIKVSANGHHVPVLIATTSVETIDLRKKDEKEIVIALENGGEEPLTWTMAGIPGWVSASATGGSLDVGQQDSVFLLIKGENLSSRVHSFTAMLTYNHPDNATISLPVTVYLVLNQAPKLTVDIDDVQLPFTSESISIDLTKHFTDPDGDSLSFTYAISNDITGTFTLNESILSFEPLSVGSVNVTLTAEDDSKSKTSMFFEIKVSTVTALELDFPDLDVQVSPNPFTRALTFQYWMEKAGDVSLVITDINGRKISELLNEHQHAGYQQVRYEADVAAKGFYFYHLTIDGKVAGRGKILRN